MSIVSHYFTRIQIGYGCFLHLFSKIQTSLQQLMKIDHFYSNNFLFTDLCTSTCVQKSPSDVQNMTQYTQIEPTTYCLSHV